MGITVDLIIIGIIAISIFLGYRKGLVALAVKLFAVIIAIVVTALLYQPVSNLIINTTEIDEAIENAILEKTSEIMIEERDENPELANELISGARDGLLPEAARELSINAVRALTMVILFIAVRIGLKFVTALANLVAKLPIIKQINKAGGIAYGLARGILIVYVALLLVGFMGGINSQNTMYKSVNQSFVGKTMMENNLLQIFF